VTAKNVVPLHQVIMLLRQRPGYILLCVLLLALGTSGCTSVIDLNILEDDDLRDITRVRLKSGEVRPFQASRYEAESGYLFGERQVWLADTIAFDRLNEPKIKARVATYYDEKFYQKDRMRLIARYDTLIADSIRSEDIAEIRVKDVWLSWAFGGAVVLGLLSLLVLASGGLRISGMQGGFLH
jgi:hypothetical protein